MRRCLASGELRPRQELLRFVIAPDGRVVFDLASKLPGRGLWLTPRRDLIERAIKRNLFARSAKRSVVMPDDLLAQIEQTLRGQLLGLLGLARRAGEVVLGHDKVRAALVEGKVALLVQAIDGAPGGRDKLRALAKHAVGAPVAIEVFNVAELSAALGRENAVHVAVSPGALADRIATGVGRLGGVLGAAADTKGF